MVLTVEQEMAVNVDTDAVTTNFIIILSNVYLCLFNVINIYF